MQRVVAKAKECWGSLEYLLLRGNSSPSLFFLFKRRVSIPTKGLKEVGKQQQQQRGRKKRQQNNKKKESFTFFNFLETENTKKDIYLPIFNFT